jgi:hypothetical protein
MTRSRRLRKQAALSVVAPFVAHQLAEQVSKVPLSENHEHLGREDAPQRIRALSRSHSPSFATAS